MYPTDFFLYQPFFLLLGIETVTVMSVILVLLFFISFITAGADVAFFSLSYKDINYLKTKPGDNFKRVVRLLKEPRVLLYTLRVANTFANIGMVLTANLIFDNYMEFQPPWLEWPAKILVIAMFILLFCEVLPKNLAAQNNMRYARDTGWLVEAIYLLFHQVSRRFVSTGQQVENSVGETGFSSETDLGSGASEESMSQATRSETNYIRGIVAFGNTTVKQIMRTRLDVKGIEYDSHFHEILELVKDFNYSRAPVYRNSLDEIKGMLHTKDLLAYQHESADFEWHKLLREAYFVHEHMLIEDLMQDFKEKHIHFAVVVDEFGGTSGIVTMEDILEEIIGDINDEFDDNPVINTRIDANNFIFEGKTMLNDVCRIMRISQDTFDDIKGESDSLAGLLLEMAGEIPRQDAELSAGDFRFIVLEVEKNRIQKVKVSIEKE